MHYRSDSEGALTSPYTQTLLRTAVMISSSGRTLPDSAVLQTTSTVNEPLKSSFETYRDESNFLFSAAWPVQSHHFKYKSEWILFFLNNTILINDWSIYSYLGLAEDKQQGNRALSCFVPNPFNSYINNKMDVQTLLELLPQMRLFSPNCALKGINSGTGTSSLHGPLDKDRYGVSAKMEYSGV